MRRGDAGGGLRYENSCTGKQLLCDGWEDQIFKPASKPVPGCVQAGLDRMRLESLEERAGADSFPKPAEWAPPVFRPCSSAEALGVLERRRSLIKQAAEAEKHKLVAANL